MIRSSIIPGRIFGAILILTLFNVPGALYSQDQPQVTDFTIRPETSEVELQVQGPIEYGYFPLTNPDRLVFDFPGAIYASEDGLTTTEEVTGACFTSVRISQFSLDPPIVRCVLYLHGPATAAVNFTPSDGNLLIKVTPDGWVIPIETIQEPLEEVEITSTESEPVTTETGPSFDTQLTNQIILPGYEIQSSDTETIIRFPGITADNIEVEQLRFPDRLHARIFTNGPVAETRPRFEQYAAGNIWNTVAKQWRSFIDRDNLGIVDLTIYLYPNAGFTQNTGADNIPEIRLAEGLRTETIAEEPEIASVEVEVSASEPVEEETVETETEIIEEIAVTPQEPEVEIEIAPVDTQEEIVEVEVLNEPVETGTTTDVQPGVRHNLIADVSVVEATESIEVIDNGTFIATTEGIARPQELDEEVEEELGTIVPSNGMIQGQGVPAMPIILAGDELLAEPEPDDSRMVMRTGDVIVVPVHNLVRASIGNPAVATVNVISQDEILVTALTTGNTTLLTWENGLGHIAREISVFDATSAREEEITDLINCDTVDISVLMTGGNPGIVLEGSVETEEEKARAAQIAALFVGAERVTNLIEVTDPRQVLVKVRVVEIVTRALDEHLSHINGSARTDNDDFTIGIITDILDPENPGGGLFNSRVRPGIVNGDASDMVYDPIDIVLNELETERNANVLSEPNVVAMSGHLAHFRVGGEIPYTYQNDQGVNVVEFKEFGIVLDMTPNVDSQNNILLNITPTVRTVDMALAIAGIPGFRTREMNTSVQLRNGETLVIGGLIQNEITEVISEIPLLSDIPILGELFRSKRFNEDETELVIFITPWVLEDASDSEELVGVDISHPALEE